MLKKGNKKGSIRSIMLKNGGVINEKLKKYQPNKMRYDYKIIDMSTVKTIQHLGDDIAVKVLPLRIP
jgi:mxaD protein